jgi:hypothetical protein
MITASFVNDQHFCDYYKRNNKGKGRKNLRCFPDCRTTGHVETGYCGRPVIVDISYDCAAAKDLDLMAFCEVRTHHVSHAPLAGVSLGKNYAFSEILEQSRGTGHNPGEKALHPWFPGFVLKSHTDPTSSRVSTTFSFNYRNQGWHYAWQAQSRQNTKHELHVFILAGSKHSAYFTCVCELTSPTFDIHCRRKTTMVQEAAAAVAAKISLAQPFPVCDIPHGQHSIKRSASEISSTSSTTEGRSGSPERQDIALVTQRYALDQIMPSNTASHSPENLFRALKVARSDAPSSSQAIGSSAIRNMHENGTFPSTSEVTPFPTSPEGIRQRIKELETRKLALSVKTSPTSPITMPMQDATIAQILGPFVGSTEDQMKTVLPPVSELLDSGQQSPESIQSLLQRIQQLHAHKQQLKHQILQGQMAKQMAMNTDAASLSPLSMVNGIGVPMGGSHAPALVSKPANALAVLARCC